MARKPDARTFGQDLMRGEHVVGGGHKLTKKKADAVAVRSGKVGAGGLCDQIDASSLPKNATIGKGGLCDQIAPKAGKSAIPGGGTGPNSAYQFKQPDGSYAAGAEAQAAGTGTSIFDPVLCELAYRWFAPPGGLILDPFAGGSVRGIVAGRLGRHYLGCDLRPEQVAANRLQAAKICADAIMPEWIVGDSAETIPALDVDADFIFSCPPYGDLEVYSDNPDDLSTMGHDGFVRAYRQIIAAAVARLKPDRFACFIVGDFRDSRGMYRDFVSETIRAFRDAGAELYNEAILVTAAGSLPIRAGKQFAATRKLGKTHQNILVFVKGDPRRATEAVGVCDFGEPEAEMVSDGDSAPEGAADVLAGADVASGGLAGLGGQSAAIDGAVLGDNGVETVALSEPVGPHRDADVFQA
jgi:hypothetical protein